MRQAGIVLAAALALGLGCVGAPAAQNWSLRPDIEFPNRLSAGFMPDPYVIDVAAGGDVDAQQALGGECRGAIRGQPARITYQAGARFPLIISARSEIEVTLVVNTPDGVWHCANGGEAPRLAFEQPQSGAYDIWVGAADHALTAPAQVLISERGAP